MPTPHTPATSSPGGLDLTRTPKFLAAALAEYPILSLDDVDDRSIFAALTADSAEDIFADPDSVGLRDITGEPFTLVGIEGILASTIKDHKGEPYIVLNAVRHNGVRFTITTGSLYAMARAVGAERKGLLPRRVMAVLLESKTDSTRSSLWLVDAPAPPPVDGGPVVDVKGKPVPDFEHGDSEEPF
jgi:hypothetical protein